MFTSLNKVLELDLDFEEVSSIKHFHDEIKQMIDSIVIAATLIGYNVDAAVFTTYLTKGNKKLFITYLPSKRQSLLIRQNEYEILLKKQSFEEKIDHLKRTLENL